MAELQVAAEDGARCAYCPRLAAGPCASCGKPVCGDCCVLTHGGMKTWAICIGCERRGGRSLRHAWTRLFLWILLVVAVFVAIAVVTVFGLT